MQDREIKHTYVSDSKSLNFTPVFILGVLQQRGIAQIVGHHDGWIQRREIQGGDRNAVIPAKRRSVSKTCSESREKLCADTNRHVLVLTLSPAQWQWHQCSLLLLLSWPQASPGPASWPKHHMSNLKHVHMCLGRNLSSCLWSITWRRSWETTLICCPLDSR